MAIHPDDYHLSESERNNISVTTKSLFSDLFPLPRSITGDAVRESLSILQKISSFSLQEIPSGTQVFDWIIPPEWNIKDAYILDSSGNKILDFKENTLHLVSYSIPFNKTVSFQELNDHLYTLPDMPEAIPYRTSYYKKDWGFCLKHSQYLKLDRKAKYNVVIDAEFREAGSLTYGEITLPGKKGGKEYIISTYICHPSLANDNLSGPILWIQLLNILKNIPHQHTYRFIIVPETIGALAYLSINQKTVKNITGGLVLTTNAGPGPFGFKETYLGTHILDRTIKQTFSETGIPAVRYPFDINGSDERQFSAPGFRIPMATITKSKYYEYKEYHTSLDNLDFITAENLVDVLQLYLLVLEKLERNYTYTNMFPYGEPQLGRRGLYPQTGGSIQQQAVDLDTDHKKRQYKTADYTMKGNRLDAIRWLLFKSDGNTSLLDIAEQTTISFHELYETAQLLVEQGLIRKESEP